MVLGYRRRAGQRVLLSQGFTRPEANAMLLATRASRTRLYMHRTYVQYTYDYLGPAFRSGDTWLIECR